MRIHNLPHNTYPFVIHRNGCGGPKRTRERDYMQDFFRTLVLEFLVDAPYRVLAADPDIDLITPVWGRAIRHLEGQSLIKTSAAIGMPVKVLSPGPDFTHTSYFNCDEKIPLVRKFLETCQKPFVLFCDVRDVALIDSPRRILAEFEKMDTEMLFAAEANHFPLAADTREFDERVSPPPFRYLNSGCWFGKAGFVRELFDSIARFELPPPCPPGSKSMPCGGGDQELFKYLHRKHFPKIKIDAECRIFQCLYSASGLVEMDLPRNHR